MSDHASTEPLTASAIGPEGAQLESIGRPGFPAARQIAELFAATAPVDRSEVSDKVERLVEEMLSHEMRCELPYEHFVAPGLYTRSLFIPAGQIAIGRVHKFWHISLVTKGRVSVLNDEGGFTTYRAPWKMASPPGGRKVVFAHEDTVWTTVHNTRDCGVIDDATVTVEELEQLLTADNPEQARLFLEEREMMKMGVR